MPVILTALLVTSCASQKRAWYLQDAQPFTPEQIAAADIDGDGKVDSTDIYYMLYYVALHGAGQKVSWEDVIS